MRLEMLWDGGSKLFESDVPEGEGSSPLEYRKKWRM